MPDVRYGQTNVAGVRTALALGSSSAPTTLYTFASDLVAPDGVGTIGGIVDRIAIMPSSSQGATRVARFFLASSSGPALTPAYQIGAEFVPANGVALVIEGPYRAKSNYILQGYIDSTAADVYASAEISEVHS